MQWVLDSLGQASERFIVANQPYDEFGVPVYADIISSQTPLSGIHSALVHAKHDWVAIAACDMPFLSKEYWSQLQQHCQDKQAVVVESEVGLEPLAALYHRNLQEDIEAHLKQNQKAVHHFLQSIAAKILKANTLNVPANTFDNINRLEDITGLQNKLY